MDNASDEGRSSKSLDDDNEIVFLRQLLHLPSCRLSVFLVLSISTLRRFTSLDEFDTEGDVGGEGGEGWCSFLKSSHECVSFLI